MPTISNISFNVKFDLTSTPALVLTDTTSTPPTGMVGIFEITQPDKYIRTGNINSPDIVSAGGAFSIPLRLASDGSVQCGTYKIKFIATAPGYLSTEFTRQFTFDYKEPKLVLTPDFDVFTPKLECTDDTVYAKPGFTSIGLSRAWTVTSVPAGINNYSNQVIDLIHNSNYYDAYYSIQLRSQLTYTSQSNPWLSIDERVSKTISTYAQAPPAFPLIVSMVGALKKKLDDAVNACQEHGKIKADFEFAMAILGHIIDKFRTSQTSRILIDLQDLLRVLKGYQVYTPTNLPIPAYDFGFSTSITSWGTVLGNIQNQADLWTILQNLYLRDHYEHDQQAATATWTVTHNMGKFPNVTIVDSNGDEIVANVSYVSNNQLTISFSSPFSGKAYLN
jgi:hypothetical protein